jgi:Zn-dependent peptidase ImmA (M78 family)
MRRPPTQISTPESATEVTNEVKRLLRAAGVKDQLPTPKEAILACARLVERGELDLAEYEATLTEKSLRIFHRAVSKVLGLLDRRSNFIYVDPCIRDSRKLFTTYHEVTHKVLSWQRITVTQDDQQTLSAECENLFEAEANYGAADILFQCERFEDEARDCQLSIESALYLRERYDSSCHAALRRFAERNHRPCLLMVLTETKKEHENGQTSYYVVYSIPSIPFTKEFGEGEPLNLKFVNPVHELGQILNNSGHGEIVLSDIKGFSRTCIVQSFNNNFNTFLLVYPKQAHFSQKIAVFRN